MLIIGVANQLVVAPPKVDEYSKKYHVVDNVQQLSTLTARTLRGKEALIKATDSRTLLLEEDR